MKITQDVRDYAKSHQLDDMGSAVSRGMKEKAAEFVKDGGQIYRDV
jgi:phosphomethylpyrimidine synthase